MARFELTIVGGEKILVDHPIPAMDDMRAHLEDSGFVVFREVKAGATGPLKEVIIATAQISLLRPLPDGSTQGSNFQPKR